MEIEVQLLLLSLCYRAIHVKERESKTLPQALEPHLCYQSFTRENSREESSRYGFDSTWVTLAYTLDDCLYCKPDRT